ncbi:MAG: VWA domain-containing protein [Rhodobacteraceae bacterium]|nr:VWA domain-containing protein [Paracoccaceae bacterium]
MTDDLDKLAALLRDDIPPPSSNAKMAAIAAGMQAFENNSENVQGTADAARPIHNRPETARGFLEGLKHMFNKLTGRQMMLGTASFATIAVALVVSQGIDFNTGPGPIVNLGAPELGIAGNLNEQTQGTITTDDEVGYMRTEQPTDAVLATPDDADANAVASQEHKTTDNAPRLADSEDLTSGEAVPMVEEAEVVVTQELRERGAVDGLSEAPSIVAPMAVMPAAPVVDGLLSTQLDGRSVVGDTDQYYIEPTPENRDQFAGAEISSLKVTLDEPVSTFSIDVDTAAYSFVRSNLMRGYLPNPDAVRTEEMINYFSYDYPVPQAGEAPFSTSVTITDTPWNPNTQLMHIAIQGYEILAEDRPPVNLVFLIDTSGSMGQPNKLPLLIQSFRLMLSELNEHDTVAIVTYAGSAGMALEPTSAGERTKILNSLTRLSAGGSTNGQSGLQQAYALAAEMADDGDTSRVILATDGDFNVGISDPEALQAFIEEKRDTGIYLSILGFGQGNYNDALMQTLAQNGNGTAAYIDTLAEAQKVLVDQIGGALFTIAQDVKIQIEFNPSEVAEYRLIGYETRALAREDFNNDTVDAGEIGAGHSVTALYEITLAGSSAISNDPLRYGDAAPLPEGNGELAFLKLRYKNPGESTSILVTTPVMADADAGLGTEVDFAVAVAGFGQLLRGDTRLGDWSFDDVVALASTARGNDTFGYRAEFIRLVRLAETAQ